LTKLLAVSANASELSFGRAVGKVFVESYKAAHPTHQVTEVNLFDIYVPELDSRMMSAMADLSSGGNFDDIAPEVQKALIASGALLQQFLDHDKYLFITPLWNSCFPARFKSYLDTLCVSGKTFTYTDDGYPRGLVEAGRKVVHIHASGGYIKTISQADAVLREVMNLIGVREIETLFIQGHGQKPDLADQIKEIATKRAIEMAKVF